MNEKNVNTLLAEITQSRGFINIDQNDIDKFKKEVAYVDAIKVSGQYKQIGDLLSGAISNLSERNKENTILKLLFAIRLPTENNFTIEVFSNTHYILDTLDGICECIWGVSTNEKLQGDNLELIVAVGLK